MCIRDRHWVVAAVDRVEAREDHGLGVGVAGQSDGRGSGRIGDGIADLGLAHVLHAGDQVADLADTETLRGSRLG